MDSAALNNVLPGSRVELTAAGPVNILSFTSDGGSSHLLSHQGASVLIDCHDAGIAKAITAVNKIIAPNGAQFAEPTRVLHTHVQPEHCREADAFPGAKIAVPAELADLAGDTPEYRRAASVLWEHPELWMETMGREQYGVGGSVVLRPPSPPLRIAETFKPDDVIPLGGDVSLRAIALPGHGWHACGFLLTQNSKPLAFFSADLFRDPAVLVNMYDLERAYGQNYLFQLPDALEAADKLAGNVTYYPATGPIIRNGSEQAKTLATKVKAYFKACEWPEGSWPAPAARELPRLGKYRKQHEGVYQLTTGGNTILFIDKQGRGLMIDPGPCDFEHPQQRWIDFKNDLAMFEKEAGLKSIELAIVTHFHGDHYDCASLLKERYPNCKLAAWDPVARVLERPDDFPYACKLPWYNVGPDGGGAKRLGAMKIDVHLTRQQPYKWNDVVIETIHLPGHCLAHGGHIFTFNGKRFAITGDTIQGYGSPETIGFVACNDSVPDTNDGCILAYKNMMKQTIDLNLGGHSSSFVNTAPLYAECVRRMEFALPALRALVLNGDMQGAFRRPWFPDLELEKV
jgi:glyoxylase-like metal-dependent hydrolase (beta-lactamase superfamily II)